MVPRSRRNSATLNIVSLPLDEYKDRFPFWILEM